MNSSAPPSKNRESEIAEWAARVCGAPVLELESCAGGRNNSVYRLRTAKGTAAVKDYAVGVTDDGRDRLHREFAALQFLEAIAFKNVPRPMHQDPAEGLGLYEFVEGKRVEGRGPEDIAAVAAFLGTLHENRGSDAARMIPPASASHFSAHELIAQIGGRLEALRALGDPQLDEFLERDFAPFFVRSCERVDAVYRDAGLDPGAVLDSGQRTLSPSDFGFHNSLRRQDGTLVFLDFEYFGWDDPVNATGNFLWHPAFTLTGVERAAFEEAARRIYCTDRTFPARLEALRPLYPLRWSLIALNEFFPASWKRRRGAGVTQGRDAAKAVQLAKAVGLLASAKGLK